MSYILKRISIFLCAVLAVQNTSNVRTNILKSTSPVCSCTPSAESAWASGSRQSSIRSASGFPASSGSSLNSSRVILPLPVLSRRLKRFHRRSSCFLSTVHTGGRPVSRAGQGRECARPENGGRNTRVALRKGTPRRHTGDSEGRGLSRARSTCWTKKSRMGPRTTSRPSAGGSAHTRWEAVGVRGAGGGVWGGRRQYCSTGLPAQLSA